VKRISSVLTVAVAFSILTPITSFASSTPIPSSTVSLTPTPSVTPSRHPRPAVSHSPSGLTQTQKDAVAAANAAFAAAKVSEQEGFDLAAADAKAILDQAITDAGTDKTAIKTAQKNFRDFKKTIASALQNAFKVAKLVRQNALAAAHVPLGTH
jgi:hypothetical protein